MTIIGNFTATDNGYRGKIRTLTLDLDVEFVANEKSSHSAPDYRLMAGDYQLGAAWAKVSKAERPYLSVSIDDPALPRTIYARLLESDGQHSLIWSREPAAA